MDIPRLTRSAQWSLFEAVAAEKIRLENCTFTIRNARYQSRMGLAAYHAGVNFIHVKAPPGGDLATSPAVMRKKPRLSIELRNCIARGEATLLRCNAQHRVELNWENGLLTTTEHLLVYEAGHTAPPEGAILLIDLVHLTAIMRNGMCRVTSSEDARQLLPAEINCVDSILLVDEDKPLVRQSGIHTEEEFKRLFQWKGDRSAYEGINVFWEIENRNSNQISQMEFNEWRKHWGPRSEMVKQMGVVWSQFPADTRANSTHAPADFALDVSDDEFHSEKVARGGLTVGMKENLLPKLPLGPGRSQRTLPSDD